MSVLFVVVCVSVLYACVFAMSTLFFKYAFKSHSLRRDSTEDANVQDKVFDHIFSNDSNLADDEYESDDEEDGYMSSESNLSRMKSRSPLHEDDPSQSGSSTSEDTSYWETDLSETQLCETHQDIESDDKTCDLNDETISGPINDEVGSVTSLCERECETPVE